MHILYLFHCVSSVVTRETHGNRKNKTQNSWMDFTKKMRETCNLICVMWLVSIHPFIHWTLLGVNCLFHTVGGVETWGLWDREELSYQVNTVFIILLTFDGRTKMPWLDCIISEIHRHRYGYIGDQMNIYVIKWTLTYTWLQLSYLGKML